jgi:hypothetical protein
MLTPRRLRVCAPFFGFLGVITLEPRIFQNRCQSTGSQIQAAVVSIGGELALLAYFNKRAVYSPGMWQRNKPIIVILVFAVAGYGIYMLDRYMKIRADSERRAAVVVYPKVDDESVSEIGYIYSMRDEVFLREEIA